MYTFPSIHRPCNSYKSLVKLSLTYRPRPVRNSPKICWIGIIMVKTSRSSWKCLIPRSLARTRGRREERKVQCRHVTQCLFGQVRFKHNLLTGQNWLNGSLLSFAKSLRSCSKQIGHFPFLQPTKPPPMVRLRLLSTFLMISLQHPTNRILQVLSWFDISMDLWVSDFWKTNGLLTADEIDNSVSVF